MYSVTSYPQNFLNLEEPRARIPQIAQGMFEGREDLPLEECIKS